MKVKIEVTVEIDSKVLKDYMKDLGTDETPTEFAKSHMISSAWNILDDRLREHAYSMGMDYSYIKVLKENQ